MCVKHLAVNVKILFTHNPFLITFLANKKLQVAKVQKVVLNKKDGIANKYEVDVFIENDELRLKMPAAVLFRCLFTFFEGTGKTQGRCITAIGISATTGTSIGWWIHVKWL